jgi:phosphoglycolate phosphatase
MRYKTVIWDWNGTLIDDTWMCLEVINELLVKYNKPSLSLEKYHQVFDFPVKSYYERIGFDFTETPFEVVGSEFMHHYWQRWKNCDLHHGAREILGKLHEHQIPQVIISAAETRLLEACVDFFDIAHYFDQLWGLDHHYATSKEGLAKEFVESVTINPADIVFIGDTVHDCDVARAAGVDSVLVCGGHHPKYKLEKCGVPMFDSLAEVMEYVVK